MQLKCNYNDTSLFLQDMVTLLEVAVKLCCVTSRGGNISHSENNVFQRLPLCFSRLRIFLRDRTWQHLPASYSFHWTRTNFFFFFFTKLEHIQSSQFLVLNFVFICMCYFSSSLMTFLILMNPDFLFVSSCSSYLLL